MPEERERKEAVSRTKIEHTSNINNNNYNMYINLESEYIKLLNTW